MGGGGESYSSHARQEAERQGQEMDQGRHLQKTTLDNPLPPARSFETVHCLPEYLVQQRSSPGLWDYLGEMLHTQALAFWMVPGPCK